LAAELKLPPRKTRAINIRQLRDAQLADFKKNKIPATATDGSVSWIRIDNVPVMGRLMVITRHQAMASSYDCNTCMCPLVFDGSVQVDPGNTHLLPTWYGYLSCFGEYEDCNYNRQWYQETSVATWSSGDTAVATVDGSSPGRIEGIGAGSTIISASYSDCGAYYPPFSGQYSCTCEQIKYSNPSSGGEVAVQKPQFVKVIYSQCGTHTCPSGYNNTQENYIPYQVLDVDQNPIPIAGLEVNETLFNASSSCPIPVPGGSGAKTDATGSFADRVWLCCQQSWSCGASWDQSFTVNSYPVLVLANGLTGSKNHIQTACQNGQGTCPNVYPVP